MTEGPETYFYYSIIKHLKGKYLKKLLILTKRHQTKDFHNLQTIEWYSLLQNFVYSLMENYSKGLG